MSKPKKPAAIQLPRMGGSYVADAANGKLERTAHTKPAPTRPAEPKPDTPAKKEA